MTGNRDDAEDLTQEAYLRAYRFFDTYDHALPFKNWLFRILSNLFLDDLRRKRRGATVSLDQSWSNSEDMDDLTPDVPDYENNPETLLLKEVLDERLQNALASLPTAFRPAVLLCDMEGRVTRRSPVRRGRALGRCAPASIGVA